MNKFGNRSIVWNVEEEFDVTYYWPLADLLVGFHGTLRFTEPQLNTTAVT